MDAGRSQFRSLLSTDPRQLYHRALSCVFTTPTTLFVQRSSQQAPSLHSGLSLAWGSCCQTTRWGSGHDRMTRLGDPHPLSSRLWVSVQLSNDALLPRGQCYLQELSAEQKKVLFLSSYQCS